MNYTGKENVYLYGATMGYSRKYIEERYDEIVEFAELKDFMHVPGGHFEFAEASYDSVYGKISVRWDKTDGGYKYKISVPSNCKADIILPDGRKRTVGAGEYEL